MTRFDDSTWIKPILEYDDLSTRYVFSIPSRSIDLVQIVADGGLLLKPPPMHHLGAHEAKNAMMGKEVISALLSVRRLCREVRRTPSKSRFFYLTGFFAQDWSNGRSIIVELCEEPLANDFSHGLLPLQVKAKDLLDRYAVQTVEHETKSQREDELFSQHPVMSTLPMSLKAGPQRPLLGDLGIALQPASFVVLMGRTLRTVENEIIDVVSQSNHNLPRNGKLRCVCGLTTGNKKAVIVLWQPRGTSVPALEVFSALEQSLPQAFLKTRRDKTSRPELDMTSSFQAQKDWNVEGADNNELSDRLSRPSEEAMQAFKDSGVEAVAWYQSFHHFTENTWGIYLFAPLLDVVASIFALDLRHTEPRAYELASRMALNLVLRHELFHARLELATSWHELASRRGRYLSYDKNVYHHFRLSPEWREEALANWSAMDWLMSEMGSWVSQGLVSSPKKVITSVESWLGLQPDGYRHWKSGDEPRTWQLLSAEIVTGRPSPTKSRRPLPIEGALRPSNMIDLQPSDIPLRVFGNGVVADRLFSAPSRREAVKLLKRFGYEYDDAGKGSHEIWRNADGVHFSLPKNDPLSVGVFHSLLKLLSLTKNAYVREVRQSL